MDPGGNKSWNSSAIAFRFSICSGVRVLDEGDAAVSLMGSSTLVVTSLGCASSSSVLVAASTVVVGEDPLDGGPKDSAGSAASKSSAGSPAA